MNNSKFFLLFVLLCQATWLQAQNDDIELNPGFISGTISIANEELNDDLRINATASSANLSSVGLFSPEANNTTEVIYTLTVSALESASLDYTVTVSNIQADNQFDTYNFAPQTITVNSQQTSQLDFRANNAGFLEGNVTLPAGATLVSADITVDRISANTSGVTITNSSTQTTPARSGAYRVAASPGPVRVECGGVIEVNGNTVGVTAAAQTVVISEANTTALNCELPVPANIETFDLVGDVVINSSEQPSHSIRVDGPFNNPNFVRQTTELPQDGPYTFADLILGTYSLRASSEFNAGSQLLNYPTNSFSGSVFFNVETGTNLVRRDVNADINALSGNINFINGFNTSFLTFVSVLGSSFNETQGGATRHTIPASDFGDTTPYELKVTTGNWQTSNVQLRYDNTSNPSDDPADFVSSRVTVTLPSQQGLNVPIITPGSSASQDIDLEFGELVINYSISDDNLSLNSPRLSGTCTLEDENDDTIYNVTFDARGLGENGSNQPNSKAGTVRLFLPKSSCTDITATARVNGSLPVFGIIDFEVEPDTVLIIDIDGPRLMVQSPDAGSIINTDTVEVSGIVTDDIGVESLTVNGIAATLTSTNNPNDPNQLAFTATIGLNIGANEITVEASDAQGNVSSNSRNVFRDDAPPTAEWTPANDTIINVTGATATVQVMGTANDDTGVKSITLEGMPLTFTSTNNPGEANEVSFETTLDVPVGNNFIELVVTDLSDREIMQVRRVQVINNRPPVANAGNDQTLEQQSAAGNLVTLDGSASADPDNDTLEFLWEVNGQRLNGESVNVMLPAGTHIATLTVTDPSNESASDTTTIIIEDTQAPLLLIPNDVTQEANGVLSSVVLGIASATDTVDGVITVTNDAPALFPLGQTIVTYTAVDSAGNTSTATQLVTIEDTIAPEVDIKKWSDKLIASRHGHKFKLAAIVHGVSDRVDESPDIEINVTGNQSNRHKKWYWFWKKKHHIKSHFIVNKGDKRLIFLNTKINRHSPEPGIYTITVTVTDASGNTSTKRCVIKLVKKKRRYSYHHHNHHHHWGHHKFAYRKRGW